MQPNGPMPLLTLDASGSVTVGGDTVLSDSTVETDDGQWHLITLTWSTGATYSLSKDTISFKSADVSAITELPEE